MPQKLDFSLNQRQKNREILLFLAFSENVNFNQEDAIMHKFINFVMKSCVNFQFYYVSHLNTYILYRNLLFRSFQNGVPRSLDDFYGLQKNKPFQKFSKHTQKKKKSVANISSQLPSNLKCTLIGLFHLLALYSPVQKAYFLCTK